MKIAVSSSFEQLMGRMDCEVYIDSCYLARLDQSMPEESSILSNPKKDVKIGACGIWEKDTKKLKLYVRIPEDSIAKSENEFERQEYAAIYFFSSREGQGGATFAIYDYNGSTFNDLELSVGRNLIDIDFPEEFEGRISLADTSQDTEFLETFGQYPGKNIHITGNEDTIVSKKTYYQYWRLEVTKDRETTDLPLLDEYGKMIVSNYRYRTYSNLVISTPGLLRNFNPPTRFGLSDTRGAVSIIGTADFIEYSVWGNTIKEELRGKTTIDSIPGSEIVYISGHDDFGNVASEVQNIFSINNYSSLIEYSPKEIVSNYGADGIFGLKVTYYDVKEGKPITITSENQIQLARRDKSDSWFIVSSSTKFTEYTDEFGEVPVYLFPYNTNGTGYFTIRTKFPTPISDPSQLQVSFENPIIESLFSVTLNLEPFVDQSGTFYVDVKIILKALTENTNEELWAPIIDEASKLVYTKISYQDYFEVFYMVQCPKIEGESLKLVDASGNTVNEVVLNYGTNSNKTYYLVANPETTDLGERNGWRIIESPEGVTFPLRTAGLLAGSIQEVYAPENTIKIKCAQNSNTAQDIIKSDIVIARLKEQGIAEDLDNTNDWRVLVDIVQIHIGFRKLGKTISIQVPSQLETGGIGLYEFTIKSNCRFTIETEDTKYDFKDWGGGENGNPLISPTYNDTRYQNYGEFKYWLRKNKVTATSQTTLSPITITASEGDREQIKTIIVNQSAVPSTIYKLDESGDEYSAGSWGFANSLNELSSATSKPYKDRDWIKQGEAKSSIPLWNSTTTYKKGDVVKWFVGDYHEYTDHTLPHHKNVTYITNSGNETEWWLCIVEEDTNPPTTSWPDFDNSHFKNVTQFFISIEDNNTGNTINSNNQTTNTYWREISKADSLSYLNSKITNLSRAKPYSSLTRYWNGDIVKHNGGYYIAITSTIKNTTGGQGYNFWNSNKTPNTSPTWWKDISNYMYLSDIIDGPMDGMPYRTILIRSVNIPYTYTYCHLYSRDNAISDDEGVYSSIKYLLDYPDKFTPGSSLKTKAYLGNRLRVTGYSFTLKASNWVELNRLEDLVKIFGNEYLDNYFFSNSSTKVFDSTDWSNRVNYSAIYPYSSIYPYSGRQVYMTTEYVEYSNLNDISIDVIPYVGTINNLPTIKILPQYSSSFRRVKDGGVIKLARFKEDITNSNWKGEYNPSTWYSQGDIVYTTLPEDGGYLYYISIWSGTHQTNPDIAPPGNAYWRSLTWTALDPSITTDSDAIIATKSALDMSSSDGISVVGSYTGTNENQATINGLQREPVPGEIIKVGSVYYYCGGSWEITNCPSSGTLSPSLTIKNVSSLNNAPDLLKGYTSVIFKYTGTNVYYINNVTYVFNNISYNKYIFVPEYSSVSTQIKFFSRKTPTETLITRDNQNTGSYHNMLVDEGLQISQPSYPIFDEYGHNDTNHYNFHILGLSYVNPRDLNVESGEWNQRSADMGDETT